MTEPNKLTAALLALFLGTFGLHKFYLGRIIHGVIYLLFCWTFIPTIVGWIECVIYLSMDDNTFAEKYGGTQRPTSETHIICPDCRELILADARVCKHCGCRLIPRSAVAKNASAAQTPLNQFKR